MIHHGDCIEVMRAMEANSVDMVVTSPPYNCGKQYGSSNDKMTYNEYWKFTETWLAESFRILRDGCRLAVNLPWWMGKKPRLDVPHKFKNCAIEAGFLFIDKVIWIKGDEKNVHTSAGCGWGTYMSPSGPSIRCASEPILVFAKGARGRRVISGEGRGLCVRGDMTAKQWADWTIDVWFVRGESSREHPAVFPREIPTRLIKLYTFPGELILDPFLGSGTTGLACLTSSRRFIGIEKEAEYVEIARRRIESAKPDMFAGMPESQE